MASSPAPENQKLGPEGQTSSPSDPKDIQTDPGRTLRAHERSLEESPSGPRGGQKVMESLEEAPKTPRSAKVIPTCTRGRIQGLPRRPLGGHIVQKQVSYEGRPQKLAISYRRGQVWNVESIVYTLLLKGRLDDLPARRQAVGV